MTKIKSEEKGNKKVQSYRMNCLRNEEEIYIKNRTPVML